MTDHMAEAAAIGSIAAFVVVVGARIIRDWARKTWPDKPKKWRSGRGWE